MKHRLHPVHDPLDAYIRQLDGGQRLCRSRPRGRARPPQPVGIDALIGPGDARIGRGVDAARRARPIHALRVVELAGDIDRRPHRDR